VDLDSTRKQLHDAHLQSDQILAELQKSLEGLEKYYLLAKQLQQSLERTLEKLNWNRDRLNWSRDKLNRLTALLLSSADYPQKSAKLLNRLVLAIPDKGQRWNSQ
jgi:hypothetical protein